ncbi:MAG: TIGR04282 family arsenosugar biosynthesis glycosyltransferase [Candidatus Omnitrophota bacterium]|nr:TIGR04282 family arsenosugar biosynthesis glycosyltransferase [Candidatus Omnitrophota bacterium]
MKRFLVIFAKEPEENMVKTRLRGSLPASRRIDLYKAFLRDTVDIAKKVDCEARIIAYESNRKTPRYLKRIASGFSFCEQKGKDLGARMHNAFKFVVGKGVSKVVIIGSDAPTLSSRYINNAFKQLDKTEIVLGPSRDGGYYLVGLKKPCVGLFKDIRWSSKTVFADTLKNVKRLKKTLSLLPYWYDVDEPSTLAKLKRDLKKKENSGVAKWTKEFFKFCELSHRQN